MGYEITLKIGRIGRAYPECKRSDKGIIDGKGEGSYVYFPYLKDAKGNTIPTGRKETTFSEYAHADLCRIGEGPVNDLCKKAKNKYKTLVVKWFVGNNEVSEDNVGDKWKPVPLNYVINALALEIYRANVRGEEPMRRYVWALALCKAVKETSSRPEEFVVMFEGH